MTWNNNWQGNNRSQRNNGNSGFNRNSSNANYKKRSGCTAGNAKGDSKRPYVRGWKASKREGLTVYMCSPYVGKNSSTKQHKSESGRVWENWACKITPQVGQPYFVSCLYEPASRKVIIPSLSMVLNPKGGRGGYCGRNYYKN